MNAFYQSSDITIASTLFYHGFIPRVISHKDNRRALFHFQQNEELTGLLDRYWKGDVRVEPRKYSLCVRELKAMTHGGFSESWRTP